MINKFIIKYLSLNDNIIKDYFHNKSVALIGNAESIFKKEFGKEIDKHDIVIRMNKGVVTNNNAQGIRTDILGNSCPFTEDEIIDYFNPKFVMLMTPKWVNFPKYSKSFYKEKVFIHPKKIWNELYKKLNNIRPTTGLMLINFIHNHTEAKIINLYGFDFFQTKSFYEGKIRTDTPHNFNYEKKFVFNLIKKSNIINIRGYKN